MDVLLVLPPRILKEIKSDGFRAHYRVFREGEGNILSDFRELSLCGSFGPSIILYISKNST